MPFKSKYAATWTE